MTGGMTEKLIEMTEILSGLTKRTDIELNIGWGDIEKMAMRVIHQYFFYTPSTPLRPSRPPEHRPSYREVFTKV